ncbi:transglutaminase domain-containing protein [Flavobacterium nackdongense]|uniref:Transglutaminase domain-containing protein n=1 Tax=Flavobacterium nackdongense TaxID=2547394 RepID=A0A4P6Y6Z2_9FLAO|nr:transglutaminase domain-containing protein [Flavobacterium nackdongense]QBN18291.1 transglutaminase domain-containing protein [Flavobacterium nackdongense]
MSKPLIWYLRRHPLLYKIRYQLVSKTVASENIQNFCYNDINKKNQIPPLFFEINKLIFDTTTKKLNDFEKAKTIAIWLRNNIKGGPGLGNSSAMALQKMIAGQGGVCSDFSQIYNNFCVINELKVREWGMKNLSSDKSISGGHSYNEVYCHELQKWVMIDVAKSIIFYASNPEIPLSSLEYIRLKKENKTINIKNINENAALDIDNVKKIYLSSISLPFLISNYDNKTIDNYLEKLDFLPVSIIHGILMLTGQGYTFGFPEETK